MGDIGLVKITVTAVNIITIFKGKAVAKHTHCIHDSLKAEQMKSNISISKFGSEDRNFNNTFNDENNRNCHNLYDTKSNNYNQDSSRSNYIPGRIRRSFSHDNHSL